MKYKIENLLALRVLVNRLKESIKNAEITEVDRELTLKFEADIKSVKGKFSKPLVSLISQPLTKEYETLLAAEMLAEGYLCIPIEGGWIVKSPSGEEYQLTENTCTCDGYTWSKEDKPCKHLGLRDFF